MLSEEEVKWSNKATINEYGSAANPKMEPIPVLEHHQTLHENGETRIINFEANKQLNIDYKCTSPNLMASFIRICINEAIEACIENVNTDWENDGEKNNGIQIMSMSLGTTSGSDGSDTQSQLVNQANARANQSVEDAKAVAHEEAERIKVSAQSDLEQAAKRTKEDLRSEVAALAVAGAERILGSEIDKERNSQIVEQIAKEL